MDTPPAQEPGILEDETLAMSVDMLCRLDFSGRFSRLSPAWERVLGWSRIELMSRPFIDFVHPDDRARTLRQNAVVRGGGRALAFTNRYLCKDGSCRWLAWNAAPHAGDRAIYSVAVDITALKVAEAAREQRLQRLEEILNELKGAGPILSICPRCSRLCSGGDASWNVCRYLALHDRIRLSYDVCSICRGASRESSMAGQLHA